MNFAEQIDDTIQQYVDQVASKKVLPVLISTTSSDSVGEIIEKLVILNLRVWMLEDAAGTPGITDEELGAIKRKIDICFKQKRPQLIQALNRLVDEACHGNRRLAEDSVKRYAGGEDK